MKKRLNRVGLLIIIAAMLLGACTPAVATTQAALPATATEQVSPAATQDSDSSAGGATVEAPPAGEPPSGAPGGPPPDGAPGGPPPGGAPGGAPLGGGGSSSVEAGLATASGAYTLDGGSETQSDQIYTAANEDQSGVYVINGGNLTLHNVTVNTSGNTSSDENSSFYGLNAGILAASGSTVTVSKGSITTSGAGANGAFATGSGSSVNLTDVTIRATGDGGHGVMVTLGGAMTLTGVNITTTNAHSAPIATDRGSGTITANGGTLTTTGQDSPCYYSTGVLNISGSTCNAIGSESVVIEGANSVILTDSSLSSGIADKWGVMIYQSFSGDAEGSNGIFSMTGGSLAHTPDDGPLFYVTNTIGNITLKGVQVHAASGTLLKAEVNDRWGTSGSNGGTVNFVADAQALIGNLVADAISSLTITLQNGSSLTGTINAENTAKSANLTLDASSTWTVITDSYLTCLADSNGISGSSVTNIIGNGHTAYYDAGACPALGGQTYTLNGGGSLSPSN